MKKTHAGGTAPASLRWTTYFLSTLLTLLLIWLLGFFLSDIGDLTGPDFQRVTERHVDQSLLDRTSELAGRIREVDTQITRQREIQQNLSQSMDNARETMKQMMDLHRLSLEQKVAPSETEQQALATSQKRFLDAQDRFESANAEIVSSSQTKFELTEEQRLVTGQVEAQHRPAQEEFDRLLRQHRFKVASFKLAFIVPLFLLAAWLVYWCREGSYRLIFVSLLIASFWKVGIVMFEHFPREFFKYIAILAAIFIVIAFFIWVLWKVAKPGAETLLKRYREAYASHLCPICSYPIVRGAFRHAIWTRKGPRLLTSSENATGSGGGLDSPYACPSCGTSLFEKCESCAAQRHSLLPFCERCGTEKAL